MSKPNEDLLQTKWVLKKPGFLVERLGEGVGRCIAARKKVAFGWSVRDDSCAGKTILFSRNGDAETLGGKLIFVPHSAWLGIAEDKEDT